MNQWLYCLLMCGQLRNSGPGEGVGVALKTSFCTISHVSAAWKNQTMQDQQVQFSQCNSLNRLNQYIEAAK